MFGMTEKIMAWIIAALLVALVGMWAYCSYTTSTLKHQLEQADSLSNDLKGQIAVLKATQVAMAGAVQVQNKAVLDLVEKQEQVTKAADAAIKAERKRAATWEGKYAAILNAPKQGDSCTNLGLKMSEYFATRHAEEEAP